MSEMVDIRLLELLYLTWCSHGYPLHDIFAAEFLAADRYFVWICKAKDHADSWKLDILNFVLTDFWCCQALYLLCSLCPRNARYRIINHFLQNKFNSQCLSQCSSEKSWDMKCGVWIILWSVVTWHLKNRRFVAISRLLMKNKKLSSNNSKYYLVQVLLISVNQPNWDNTLICEVIYTPTQFCQCRITPINLLKDMS